MPATRSVAGFSNVTVLGGGIDAQLLAALCLAAGARVQLFSAYGAELEALRNAAGITLRGAGPIGTFAVDQSGVPSIQTTAELDRAVANAELIILTGPVHKQRTYAMVLADHLTDGQTLLITPSRTFGALEVAWHLKLGACSAQISVIELLNAPYSITAAGQVLHLTGNTEVGAAVLGARPERLQALAQLIGPLSAQTSVLHSSFADGSGLVEVPALLLGGPACRNGQPQVADGGVPLAENNTFRNLIGAQHMQLIDAMAQERRAVAARFGIRDLPSTEQWLDNFAGSASGQHSRAVPDQMHALTQLRCAVTGSLVPLLSAAEVAAVAVPVTASMVTASAAAIGSDLSTAGRKLEALGIDTTSIEKARGALDNLIQSQTHGR